MRQINLLPEELQKAEQIKTIRNSLLATLVPTVLVVIVIHFVLALSVGRLRQVADQPLLPNDTPELRSLRSQMSSLKTELSQFVKDNAFIVKQLSKHFSSPGVLESVAQSTFNKVWLTDMKLNAQKEAFDIEGRSFNTRLVSEFMLELKKLPYFERVELVTMGKSESRGRQEVDFNIVCKLK